MLKRFREHIPTIISVVATVLLLAVTLIWFDRKTDSRIEDINGAYLIENNRALSSVFSTKLEDQLVMLESQSRYFEGIDLADYNLMKDTIMATKGIGEFKTIGVANAAGATINYNGKSSGNLLLEDFFRTALHGETAVSDTVLIDEEGEKVLMVGIPIKQKGRPVGVIFGTFANDELSYLLNTSSFADSGMNLLLDSDGSIIAASDSFNADKTRINNLFTDTGAQKPAKNKDLITLCMVGGTESFVVVSSVGVHGWYFVSVLPKSVVDAQASAFSRDLMIFMMIILFAFLILFISIMYLLKSNSDMLRSNERFKLVTVESQDMVFDYDYQKQRLILDGNTDNLATDGRNEFTKADTISFLDLIHEEDKDIRSSLLALTQNDESSVKGEFRMKCTDDSYCWFRMKATVVRGHDGHPQRIIGSLINVDEQMNRELKLVEKAETDPLTGIYSKSAFYSNVNDSLRSASDSDLFAIYIIDIDNFKSVNDDLGHAMADQVLADVAKKLCIVFSDMDYVGRVGGDEFAAFLHLSSKARSVGMRIIEEKAKAICSQMRETYSAKKKQVSITASVGVSIYPYTGRDYNTLFRRAGKALEYVKENGKDAYGIYSPEEHEKPLH